MWRLPICIVVSIVLLLPAHSFAQANQAEPTLPEIVVEPGPIQSRQTPVDVVGSPPANGPATPSANTFDFGNDLSDLRFGDYPQTAISRGWEGTVLLRVHVSSGGEVTDVEVIASSGFSVLDGAARKRGQIVDGNTGQTTWETSRNHDSFTRQIPTSKTIDSSIFETNSFPPSRVAVSPTSPLTSACFASIALATKVT